VSSERFATVRRSSSRLGVPPSAIVLRRDLCQPIEKIVEINRPRLLDETRKDKQLKLRTPWRVLPNLPRLHQQQRAGLGSPLHQMFDHFSGGASKLSISTFSPGFSLVEWWRSTSASLSVFGSSVGKPPRKEHREAST
jgi:hypothetical protein